jgi:hypothetical protein
MDIGFDTCTQHHVDIYSESAERFGKSLCPKVLFSEIQATSRCSEPLVLKEGKQGQRENGKRQKEKTKNRTKRKGNNGQIEKGEKDKTEKGKRERRVKRVEGRKGGK